MRTMCNTFFATENFIRYRQELSVVHVLHFSDMAWVLCRLKEGDLMKKIEAARDEVCLSTLLCFLLFIGFACSVRSGVLLCVIFTLLGVAQAASWLRQVAKIQREHDAREVELRKAIEHFESVKKSAGPSAECDPVSQYQYHYICMCRWGCLCSVH